MVKHSNYLIQYMIHTLKSSKSQVGRYWEGNLSKCVLAILHRVRIDFMKLKNTWAFTGQKSRSKLTRFSWESAQKMTDGRYEVNYFPASWSMINWFQIRPLNIWKWYKTWFQWTNKSCFDCPVSRTDLFRLIFTVSCQVVTFITMIMRHVYTLDMC